MKGKKREREREKERLGACIVESLNFICDHAYKIQRFIVVTLLLTGSLVPSIKSSAVALRLLQHLVHTFALPQFGS